MLGRGRGAKIDTEQILRIEVHRQGSAALPLQQIGQIRRQGGAPGTAAGGEQGYGEDGASPGALAGGGACGKG